MFTLFKRRATKAEPSTQLHRADSETPPGWGARFQAQLDRAEQVIAKLEGERGQLEQLAAERQVANDNLQREGQAQRERTAAAEATAAELAARLADLKDELERARIELRKERQACEAARKETQTAARSRAS